MKRPVVIFRFGNQEPVLADIKAMQILTDGTMLAMGCNTPFGVASVVITDRTHAEILEVFKDAADEHDDILPLMVFNYGDAALHFPFGGVEGMLECVPQFVEDQGVVMESREIINMNLDDILDKISKRGIESLTESEFKFLEQSSNL
jgi:hypothetical protein